MKQTLLELTQDILSNLSSDEVNSISDTAESLQVATIIKQKYFDIISRSDLTKQYQLFQLNPSLDETSPVLMFVPDGIGKLEYIKYFNSNNSQATILIDEDNLANDIATNTPWMTTSNSSNTIGTGIKIFTVGSNLQIGVGNTAICTSGSNVMNGVVQSYIGTILTLDISTVVGSGTFSSWDITEGTITQPAPGYQYVTMLPIQQFLDKTSHFNPAEFNVESFTFSDTSNNFPGNFTFYYKNDHQPRYCCVLSNFYIIFDSFDQTQDSTLQSSKSMCYGQVIPTWRMEDSFIPNLDDKQFPLLINEAKSLAFFELKQTGHAKAEQESKRQWSSIQRTKHITDVPSDFNQLPNFGRKSPGTPGRTFINWGGNSYSWL